MGKVKLRKKLLDDIAMADERLLKVVNAVVESYNDFEDVAFSYNGVPLTAEKYRDELTDAETELLEHKTISQENLERESESWWWGII